VSNLKNSPITKWDLRFIDLAKHVSQWSKDPSTKVGAVIVSPDKTDVILAFNGFPIGMNDDEEIYNDREKKLSRIVHAEMNALLLARRSVNGYCLYTWPFLPCDRCAPCIIQSGIKKVVSPYATKEQLERWGKFFELSLQYFKEAGVEVVFIERFFFCDKNRI